MLSLSLMSCFPYRINLSLALVIDLLPVWTRTCNLCGRKLTYMDFNGFFCLTNTRMTRCPTCHGFVSMRNGQRTEVESMNLLTFHRRRIVYLWMRRSISFLGEHRNNIHLFAVARGVGFHKQVRAVRFLLFRRGQNKVKLVAIVELNAYERECTLWDLIASSELEDAQFYCVKNRHPFITCSGWLAE